MERQASKKFYNKCSDNSSSQIVFRTDIFRKLTLGAPGLLVLLVSYYVVVLGIVRCLQFLYYVI